MSLESLGMGNEIKESMKTRSAQSFDPDRRIRPEDLTSSFKDFDRAFDIDKRIKADVKRLNLDELIYDYLKDVISKSEYPETIQTFEISVKDIKNPTPEEKAKCFSEYVKNKEKLRSEWERKYGIDWPRYKEDVIDENGTIVRYKGDPYDAHHLLPRSLGGGNTASNITPLHVLNHYDHRGVHAKDSPFNSLRKHVMEM